MPLTSQKNPGTARLAACAVFVFAPVGIQMPFFPLWLSASGYRADLIALLLGVAPLVRFVSNLVIPPRADRTGDAAGLLFLCAAVTAAAQALGGMAFSIAWIFALTLAATAAQGPMIPLLDSIVLREVRRRVVLREPPMDYGAVRGAGSVAVLVLMLASGIIVGAAPPSAIIWLIVAASFVAAVAVRLLLPGARGAASSFEMTGPRGKIENLGAILLVIAASSAVQASHATIYAFGSIGWRQAGYSDSSIGVLWACGVTTEVVLFLFANRLARGRSLSHAFLAGGSLVAVFRWLLMASAPGPGLLFFGQLLHAGSFAATYLGTVTALAALAGERRRAQIQGWVSAANALSLAAMTVLSGPLWSGFGAKAYLAPAALAAVGFVCACAAGLHAARVQPHRAGSGGNTSDPS
jgi:PPP family 3-phenylpropionic acid transporter